MNQLDFARIAPLLAAPFSDGAVKWKIQTKPNDKGMATVVSYVNARDVAARLNQVVGLEWSTVYRAPVEYHGERYGEPYHEMGVTCELTVGHVTRTDVGTTSDTEPLKGMYSDAFKRAAVHFGVGAYLYQSPSVMAATTKRGRTTILTGEAAEELEALTRLIHRSAASLPRFSHLWVFDYAPVTFPAVECELCRQQLVSDKMPSAQVAAYTRQITGRDLCASCFHESQAAQREAA